MKMNIFLFGALALIPLVACNDYIDVKPISVSTTDNAYEEAGQIEGAITGVYESFHSAEYYVWDNVVFQDVRSDNYYAGGDNAEIFAVDQLNISTTNSRVFKNWSNLFNAIAKANTVLDNVDAVTDPALTEVRRSQIKGEALFLRAYNYYNLVNMWGGVPLILRSVTSADPSAVQAPRASTQEVFNQILADLDQAILLLPDTYGTDPNVNKARATAGAANALAAKACMQQPTPDYTRALQYIAKVETSAAHYKLIGYAELFDGKHYNNEESILEIQYLGGKHGNFGPQLLLPKSISGDDWRKFVTPSHDLINAYDAEGDVVRKNASVLFEKCEKIDEYWGNAAGSLIPYAYKWKSASGWASTDREYLLRFGDILLLKAEALNELGQLDASATVVDIIRKRVSLPALTAEKKSSKDVLRISILKERRLELAQEAQRWDDLVRNKVAVSTMNALVEIDLRNNQPVTYGMTEAKILLPIPQQELDRNPLLTQNPL